jgi:hypothetical protein
VAEPVGFAVLILPIFWSWPFRWPLMAAAVSVGIGIAVRRLAEARYGRQAIAAARRGPARPVLAILSCDATDQPVLLLADEVIEPAELWAVLLQPPLPHGTKDEFLAGPVKGTARGRLAEDEAVVVTLTGASHALLPSSPAWRPPLEELADLLDSAGALDRAYPPMSGRGGQSRTS